MTTTHLFLIAITVGIIAGLYLPLNGRLGEQLGSPLLATPIFFIVGAFTSTTLWFSFGTGDASSRLSLANPALLGLGVISCGIILSATYFIPRMGPGAWFACVVTGEILVGMTLSHFGLLSAEKLPMSPLKAFGVLALLIGIFCIRYSETQTREVLSSERIGSTTQHKDPAIKGLEEDRTT